jgi:uncharacterized membrane protein
MSLDYPLFEEMRRRNSKAAKWWRIGDILYYVGLIGGFTWLLTVIGNLIYLAFSENLISQNYLRFVLRSFLILGGFILLFFLGGYFKKLSYQIAAKEGINPSDY